MLDREKKVEGSVAIPHVRDLIVAMQLATYYFLLFTTDLFEEEEYCFC